MIIFNTDLDNTIIYSYKKDIGKEKINVETGVFGAEMKVDFINDGPITIMLEKENGNA